MRRRACPAHKSIRIHVHRYSGYPVRPVRRLPELYRKRKRVRILCEKIKVSGHMGDMGRMGRMRGDRQAFVGRAVHCCARAGRMQRVTKKRSLLTDSFYIRGAGGETRTPTGEPPLDPEPSVSTNSTTSARYGASA